MAQLIKRPSSPYYYARFQVNGKDRWLSTKKTDRKQADKELTRMVAQHRKEFSIDQQLDVLMDMIAHLPQDLQLTKRQDVIRALMRGQEQKIALSAAWERWLANPNKDYDPKAKTLLGYQSIWKRFMGWVEPRKLHFLHELSAADAEAYAGDLWKSKVSPATYNQHIKFLRSIFSALETEAGLVTNPWAKITSTKKSLGGGRRNLTMEELQTVLAKAEGNLRLMFIIGIFTGLRLADVVNLQGGEHRKQPISSQHGAAAGVPGGETQEDRAGGQARGDPSTPGGGDVVARFEAEAKGRIPFPGRTGAACPGPEPSHQHRSGIFRGVRDQDHGGHRRIAPSPGDR